MISWSDLGSLISAWVSASREGESFNARPRRTEVQYQSQYFVINIKYLVLNPPVPKHDIASIWND